MEGLSPMIARRARSGSDDYLTTLCGDNYPYLFYKRHFS